MGGGGEEKKKETVSARSCGESLLLFFFQEPVIMWTDDIIFIIIQRGERSGRVLNVICDVAVTLFHRPVSFSSLAITSAQGKGKGGGGYNAQFAIRQNEAETSA